MFSLLGVTTSILSLHLFAEVAHAATHKAFVGREGAPDVIYTIAFDDEALTLELAANTSVPVPPGFLAFNVSPGMWCLRFLQSNDADRHLFIFTGQQNGAV